MIDVQNVTKRFGGQTALDGVSFSVRPGELLGLLGPNGAGKTTCMRIIAGYLPPSEGRAVVNGLDVFEHPEEVKRMLGYMPEQPPLYDDMTSAECLEFVAEVHGIRGAAMRRAIDRAAERCGVTEVLQRLTGNLSKGYRQRVGLAQALIHDPGVLVLDEPTAGLDPRQVLELRRLIQALGAERTVVVSSHILSEVVNLCQSVAIISAGRLVAADSIGALVRTLSTARRFTVRVARPGRMGAGALASLRGVASAEQVAENEYAVALAKADDEAVESLAAAVVSAGAGLIELREQAMTLEEVFMRAVFGGKT